MIISEINLKETDFPDIPTIDSLVELACRIRSLRVQCLRSPNCECCTWLEGTFVCGKCGITFKTSSLHTAFDGCWRCAYELPFDPLPSLNEWLGTTYNHPTAYALFESVEERELALYVWHLARPLSVFLTIVRTKVLDSRYLVDCGMHDDDESKPSPSC